MDWGRVVEGVRRGVEDLAGLRMVVTAGGTAEAIDAVRVITNLSTGKMGHALAQAAAARGAAVTLISSAADPTILGVKYVPMSDVADLRQAVLTRSGDADMVVMAAAVSDFRPVQRVADKIAKTGERLTIDFEPVPDFMGEVPLPVFKVGFAAETAARLRQARRKLAAHSFDLLCANPIDQPGCGFGADTNLVTLMSPNEADVVLPMLAKLDVAHLILDHASRHYRRRTPDAAGVPG